MNSRIAWWVIRSPLMSQLPRRSSASQPYTAGTFGQRAIARATIGSIRRCFLRRDGGGEQRGDRMRLVDAEALRVADAHGLQPEEHILLFDALGDDAEAEALADAQDRVQLAARALARDHLARDAAIDLEELHAERLHRRERYGAAAEAVDQERRAHRFHLIGKALGCLRPNQRVGLVDLEDQPRGGHLAGGELAADEARELGVFDRLAGDVHSEARDARALREVLHRVAHHPAVKQGHHAIVLENRQEFSRGHQRALLFAQAYQHFGHRVALVAGELQDRLAIELEIVVLDGTAQALDRIAPAGKLRIHPLEELVFHRSDSSERPGAKITGAPAEA